MFFKRSQIPSQIFIYVVAIILFAFVLIYGYNAITGFKERSEQIAYIKFKTDLTSTVKRVSSDYGTLKKEEFFIGGEYKRVCFVQNYKPYKDKILLRIDHEEDRVVYDSVYDDINKNVFLFTNTLQESFDVGEINTTNEGYLCINASNGKVRVQFEGKGDHTLISEWG